MQLYRKYTKISRHSKAKSDKIHIEGMGFRKIERLIRVSRVSVIINRVKKFTEKICRKEKNNKK